MPRKTKRLYDNMIHSNSQKKKSTDALAEKRKRIDEEEAKPNKKPSTQAAAVKGKKPSKK